MVRWLGLANGQEDAFSCQQCTRGAFGRASERWRSVSCSASPGMRTAPVQCFGQHPSRTQGGESEACGGVCSAREPSRYKGGAGHLVSEE